MGGREEGPILIVGMPGSGKTTLGLRLARPLERDFVDLDHEIELRTGVRVPVIFDIEGEVGFRRRESETLGELMKEPNLLIATGGGTILDPENRIRMQSAVAVIYLQASPEILFKRTIAARHRPLLRVPNPMERIQELLKVREPLYQEVASLTMRVSDHDIAKLVRQVKGEFNRLCVT